MQTALPALPDTMRLKGLKVTNLLGTISTVVVALGTLLGGGYALFRWLYRRGGDERELTAAVRSNTTAQHELASSLRDFKEFTVSGLHELALSHERLAAEVAVLKEKISKGA